MGLDGVELILAVEEEFQIEIEDEDAWEFKTVIQLVDYVYFKIKKKSG